MVRISSLLGILALTLVAIVAVACQPIQPETAGAAHMAAPDPSGHVSPTDPVEVQISNAMSAAPT